MENKYICIITQTSGFGGTEVHALGLMKTLIDRGYRIELISCCHSQYDEKIRLYGWQDNVDIIHTELQVDHQSRNLIVSWQTLLKSVHRDLLIFPKGANSMGSIRFLRLCRRWFKKVVYIEQLEALPGPEKTSRLRFGVVPGPALWWYKAKFLTKARSFYADRIIAVSNKVKECLIDEVGYTHKKIIVIHNGVPWQNYTRNEKQGMAFRSHHGIAQDAFVFGMLARLHKIKGIDVALHALHLLTQKELVRSICLVIAGEGQEEQELKNLTKKLGIDHCVKFVGFIRDEIAAALSAYDVILFSSRLEGLPLGLLEGMSAGCIPIVTRVSGMPEAVHTSEIGWVVSPENPLELCDAMEAALKLDNTTLSQMRQNGLRRIQEHFDSAECYRKFLDVCGLLSPIDKLETSGCRS